MRRVSTAGRLAIVLAIAWTGFACNSPVDEIPLSDIEGDLLIVANKSSASVWAIDLATKRRVREWLTPAGPHEVAISPNRTSAVISIYGGQTAANTLVVIDIASLTPRGAILLGQHLRPHGLAFLNDRVVAVTAANTNAVVLVDVVTGELPDVLSVGDDTPHMVVASAEGDRVWTANAGASSVSEIHVGTGEVERLITVDEAPEALAISPDGSHVWVGSNETDRVSVIDAETGEVIDSFVHNGRPVRIAFLPDGSAALVTYLETGVVRLVHAQSLEVVDEIQLGGQPVGTIVHPDGHRAYIALGGTGEIVVLDVFAMQEIERIGTGFNPDGMGFVRWN